MIHAPELSVAPMEGLTTFPMRLWLTMCSQPRFMTSPFLKVTRAFAGDALPDTFVPELMQLRDVLPYKLVPQFITADPELFLRAADLLPAAMAPVLEINCGCPSPNSMGQFAGSGMLRDPEFFGRSLEKLVQTLGPGRLAVKMRLGMQSDAEFPTLLAAICELPLARLTVHARTRADGYRGQARWAEVQRAACSTRTPVHASGDIWGWTSWQRLRTVAPDIQGAMIGRGLLRNPWIFSELRNGTSTHIPAAAFVHALFCLALLQELFLRDPGRLMQKVARGRLGTACGIDAGAWEKATVELTGLVFGVPFLLLQKDSWKSRTLSPVAFSRLRFLWSYLRSSLPEPLAAPGLMRCRKAEEFFEQLQAIIAEAGLDSIEVSHQEAWDTHFAGQRA